MLKQLKALLVIVLVKCFFYSGSQTTGHNDKDAEMESDTERAETMTAIVE